MIKVFIKKPLNGFYVAVDESKLRSAIRRRESIIIACPGIEATVSPKDWIKTGKRIEKVFNYPNNPMILYSNSIKNFVKNDRQMSLI